MEAKDSDVSDLEKARNLMLACVKENGYVMEPLWKKEGELLKEFQAKADDVWIMTLPRSGTTLTQELVYLIMNDFDFESARKYPPFIRIQSINTSLCSHIWSQCSILMPSKSDPKKLEMIPVDSTKSSAEVYVNLPSPRIFKSHLAFSIIPSILKSGAKTIYVARNPKDRLVSWWKFLFSMCNLKNTVDFATFWRHAKNEQILYEPTWKHIKEGWAQRNNPNVLFLFYEDMRTDFPSVITKVAAFLGKSITDEQMKQTLHYLDIDVFRDSLRNFEYSANVKDSVHEFVGKGKIGGYKDVITPEVEKEMDEWMEENLRGTDIVVPW